MRYFCFLIILKKVIRMLNYFILINRLLIFFEGLMKHHFGLLTFITIFLVTASLIPIRAQSDSSNVGLSSANLKIVNVPFSLKEKKSNLINPVLNKLYPDTNRLTKKNYSLNPIKFGVLTTVTLGMSIGLHNFQKHAWWSGERGQFHIQNDWAYAMSMDKIGHFMEGGLIEKTMKGAFIWSGMEERTAMWFGALFSIGYMTDIEIEDGFAKAWGYSPGDEIANLTGDIFAIAQDMWTPLQTVKLKWSYVPSNDTLHKGDFPDDYNGQVFWLSFNINKYFGKKFEEFWPDYLNLAIGYGVKDYEYFGPGGRSQNLYIGFDFDVRKIIPGNSSFMRFVKEFLNTFKFIPTPAIKWNMTYGKIQLVVH